MQLTPFLRTPPFPGHRGMPIAAVRGRRQHLDPAQVEEAQRALLAGRVGGSFWGAPVQLPPGRTIVLAPLDAADARRLQNDAATRGFAGEACLIGPFASRHGIPVIARLVDPWHVVAQASRVVTGRTGDWIVIAALLGVPVEVPGQGDCSGGDGARAEAIVRDALAGWDWRSPFTGQAVPPVELVGVLSGWRRLIEQNRRIDAVFGVARWKRVTMDPLLWDGAGAPRHISPRSRSIRSFPAGARVLAWQSRVPEGFVAGLRARGVTVGEVEDGMIRSSGLGANCVPPLSIVVDLAGAYFDPTRSNGLEVLLQHGDIAPEATARAAALRKRLVTAGIGKYGRAASTGAAAAAGAQRRVLVTGQVADDRSVLAGGGDAARADNPNLALLRAARALEPDAWLIYKPHPDVEAGHRAGAITESEMRRWADEIHRAGPIAPLLDRVDGVHVLTSLAGFEALLRGRDVTTHGVPFYAGWGLTRDLGPVPPRRSRRRTVDELVAATLVLYPRYVDPVTRLPCPVEVLVERLEQDSAVVSSPLVRVREVQGRFNRLVRRIGEQA